MRRPTFSFGSLVLILAVVSSFASAPTEAAELSGAVQVGAVGGIGGDVYLELADFAQGLPVDLRVGLEWQTRDAGDPMGARRIFINDNTNGTPESSARAWGARIDLVAPLRWGSNVVVFGGPRWVSFTGAFDYIGGNENFEVVSEQWGWGIGLEGRYAVSPSTDFVLGGGVDWYLDAALDGHDTIYSPNLDPVNGRADYDYDDADDVIAQPGLDWRLLLGVQRVFGR